LRWREGSAVIQWARRKCLILYYYFMDREFGLIHVRVQTWFPLPLQVYVNGHGVAGAGSWDRTGAGTPSTTTPFGVGRTSPSSGLGRSVYQPAVGGAARSLCAPGEPIAARRADPRWRTTG